MTMTAAQIADLFDYQTLPGHHYHFGIPSTAPAPIIEDLVAQVAAIDGVKAVYRDEDSFAQYGEPLDGGEPEHVVVEFTIRDDGDVMRHKRALAVRDQVFAVIDAHPLPATFNQPGGSLTTGIYWSVEVDGGADPSRYTHEERDLYALYTR